MEAAQECSPCRVVFLEGLKSKFQRAWEGGWRGKHRNRGIKKDKYSAGRQAHDGRGIMIKELSRREL